MGIPGLTTYINSRSDRYLEYYELHDTYLVIDGNSVNCQIYSSYAKCNCTFGGDYDNYAQCVSDFFDDLLKCNITPLVLFDGGSEDKKLKTLIKRTKDKIRTASFFSPLNQPRLKFFPLLMKEVFKDIIREKNIRYVQCLFEADNDIAAVSKILNCPVLSYDSDFYVYGTLYIPFNTLDSYVVKKSTGTGYMKRCKIYRVKCLLNSFKGLDQSMLSLAAILLGNDYIKRGTFKNFLRHLKLRGASRKKHNYRQCLIEATFNWLSTYTLEKAIIGILSRIAKPWRQKILSIIETNINNYTNISAQILIPLGFKKDYVAHENTYHLNKIFKFEGDINTLTYIEEICEEEDNEMSEEDDDEIDILQTFHESEQMSENTAVSNLPTWFVNEFLMGRYPTYFMDIIVRCLYICPIQIEDYCHPSSVMISLKIVSVIFGLLKSGINNNVHYMRCIIRNQSGGIMYLKLKPTDTVNGCKLPSLSNLREIPLIVRREILNNTLGITNLDFINELPLEWMLYVACIKYWVTQQKSTLSYKYCLYSILVSMLFNRIDSMIGKHRFMYNFQTKYGQVIKIIKEKRKLNNYKLCYTMNGTVIDAYNEIDYDDCILAAPFFISHFEMDQKLYKIPKQFNRSIVHVFAEFQNCLRHTMNLNALLGYPYPQIKVANLFNGTLLYNLSSNFKTRYDIEAYIGAALQMSPSLLRLFNTILLKVKAMFPLLLQNGINLYKKRRVKSKHLKSHKNLVESDTEYFDAEDNLNEACYDPNNRFSVLSCT